MAALAASLLIVAAAISRRERLPFTNGPHAETIEIVGHIAIAAGLAAGLYLVAATYRWRPGPGTIAIGVAASATTLIEVAQLSASSRAVSTVDLVANLTGVLIGWGIGAALHRSRLAPVPAATLVLVPALVAGLIVLVAPVPLGRGCPTRQLPVTDAAPPRLGDLAVELTRPGAPPSDQGWRVLGNPTATATGALEFADPDDRLESARLGAELSQAIRDSGYFAIEVVATVRSEANGPRPMIAISRSNYPSDMNVRIGQHGDDLSIRVRLGCGQFNWTQLDGHLTPGGPRRIMVTLDQNTQTTWIDTTMVDRRTFDGYRPTSINWDTAMPLVIGNDHVGDDPFQGVVHEVRIATTPGPTVAEQ